MILYYSGTGNSRFCAQKLGQALSEPVQDAFPFIREKSSPALTSHTPWVFVSPTYGWRLPRIFTDLLRRITFQGNQNAYFLMTCGSEVGNAGKYNHRLCQELGLRDRGTFQVIMPENYIALFSAPETAEAIQILQAALPSLQQSARLIQSGEDFSPPAPSLLDRMKSALVNPLFYRFILKADPFTVSDSCIGCGHCASVCPLDNIRLTDHGRPHWGDRCTHCMACICGCPVGAIEYGRASVGKPRYQCPDL